MEGCGYHGVGGTSLGRGGRNVVGETEEGG